MAERKTKLSPEAKHRQYVKEKYASDIEYVGELAGREIAELDFADEYHVLGKLLFDSCDFLGAGTMTADGDEIVEYGKRHKVIEELKGEYLHRFRFAKAAKEFEKPEGRVLEILQRNEVSLEQHSRWITNAKDMVNMSFSKVDPDLMLMRVTDRGVSCKEALQRIMDKFESIDFSIINTCTSSSWTEMLLEATPEDKRKQVELGIARAKAPIIKWGYDSPSQISWGTMCRVFAQDFGIGEEKALEMMVILERRPDVIAQIMPELINYLATYKDKGFAYIPVWVADLTAQYPRMLVATTMDYWREKDVNYFRGTRQKHYLNTQFNNENPGEHESAYFISSAEEMADRLIEEHQKDYKLKNNMKEKILIKITNGEELTEQVIHSTKRWNLTPEINGATSRHRLGEWLLVREDGRVQIACSSKTAGGSLLNGARMFQLVDEVESNEITLASNSGGRRWVSREIPEKGSVVVVKDPQRFEFSFLEK